MNSTFVPFAITFGLFMVISTIIMGWTLKTSSAPVFVKTLGPALLVVLSIWTPFQIKYILGTSVDMTIEEFPNEFEFLGAKQIDNKTVEIWMNPDDGNDKLVHTELTTELRKILYVANDKIQNGERVMIHLRNRKSGKGENQYDNNRGSNTFYELKDIGRPPDKEKD